MRVSDLIATLNEALQNGQCDPNDVVIAGSALETVTDCEFSDGRFYLS